MTRLVMIMGVQRSGTNALFKCLGSGRGVRAYNEDDPILFSDCNLRPEPEIRASLAQASHVLLKPINETKLRSVAAVLEEFEGYDTRVAWIYRDPVNCYQSHVLRWEGFRDRPDAFAKAWCERNRSALDALDLHGERIAIVRYEDLVHDPRVLSSLASYLDVPGAWLFRADSQAGRRELSPPLQQRLDEGTGPVLAQLDQARRFSARSPLPSGPARLLARVRGRLLRQIGT